MASEIKVDTVSEKTSGSGVTIDGLLIKDGGISGDVSLIGTTPTFTIGDAGAEDATLLFDGNAQDYHVGLDDSSDSLVIGLGSTLGTTPAITINSSQVATLAQRPVFSSGITIADAGQIGSASDADAIAIASNGVVTFSQNPVFPDGGIAVADLDIDGATDIGAAIVDADLFIVDDGAGGTNRKVTASRLKTYAGGKVLQVVSTTKTTTFTTTSSSFTDITGLTVDITPASSSNTILVISALNGSQDVAANRTYLKLVRDTTDIFIGDAASNRLRGSGSFSSAASSIMDSGQPAVYLDSPSTTSAVTYKWQMAVPAGSGSGYLNRTEDDNDETTQIRAASTITVMEIGA